MSDQKASTDYINYILRNKKNKLYNEGSLPKVKIAPKSTDYILKTKKRWNINPESIGMLEKLARARYEVSKITEKDVDQWEEVLNQEKTIDMNSETPHVVLDAVEQIIQPIANSVWASSEIEGESIQEKHMPIAIIGQANPNDFDHNLDYQKRFRGTLSIYTAYIRALARNHPLEGGDTINPQFIFDIHKEMFTITYPEIAGKVKAKPNVITVNNEPIVEPLAPELVNEYLDAICKRLNRNFNIAIESGRYSILLSIAEFIVDFLAIHPFADGNGRTARLLSTYLLERGGFHFARFYSLDSIILNRRADYYRALQASQLDWGTPTENQSEWIRFYIEVVYSQYLMAKQSILDKQNQ